jgi:lysophospholipase L1-like esterase
VRFDIKGRLVSAKAQNRYSLPYSYGRMVLLYSFSDCGKLILYGANDACLKDGPTGQHVPLQQYRHNLKTILTHSINTHNPTIFLITPPPINELHLTELDLKKGYSSVTRLQKVTAQYAEVVREVAKEYEDEKVVLVDLWEALMEARLSLTPVYEVQGEKRDDEGLRKLLVDGLHLTGAGYKVFSDTILPLVGKDWASELPEDPAWIFP